MEQKRPFMIVEDDETEENIEFFCEELAINELNDEIVEDIRPSHVGAKVALDRVLQNTNWKSVPVDNLGLNSTNVTYIMNLPWSGSRRSSKFGAVRYVSVSS